MTAARLSAARKLRGLKNISWLTTRQLDKLSNALTVTVAEKRAIIFDEKHSHDTRLSCCRAWLESPAAIARVRGPW